MLQTFYGIIVFAFLAGIIYHLFSKINAVQSEIADLSAQIYDIKKELIKQKDTEHKEMEAKPPVIKEEIQVETPKSEEIYQEFKNNIYQEDKTDFEKLFMGNLFVKLGALAVIIGLAIFVKLISPYIVLTPLMQILLAYLAGFGLFTTSILLNNKKFKNYSEILMGTSFAVSFITTYCGSTLQGVIPSMLGIAIGIFLVILSHIISYKYNTVSTMITGLAGGYFMPFFCGFNTTMDFLSTYFVFLNIIPLVYTLKNKKCTVVNVVNIILTTIVISTSSLVLSEFYLQFAVAFWLIYFIGSLFYAKDTDENVITLFKGMNWCNIIALLFLLNSHSIDTKPLCAAILAAAIILYVLAGYFTKDKNKTFSSVLLSTACLVSIAVVHFAFPIVMQRTCAWAIEGVIFAALYRHFKEDYFKNYALASICVSMLSIIHPDNFEYLMKMDYDYPILNQRLALLILPSLCAFISNVIINTKDTISNLLKFFSLTFLYLYIMFEIYSLFGLDYSVNYQRTISEIIVGFVYSINLKLLGKKTNFVYFHKIAVFLFFAAVIALIFSQFSYSIDVTSSLFRTFAFAVAIGACEFFARTSEEDKYRVFALVLGLLFIVWTSSDLLKDFEFKAPALSVTGLIYSGIIMLIGIIKNKKYLKLTGIWITILGILKLVFVDLSGIDVIYKVIEFLILGAILLYVSYFYTKRNN